MSLQVDVSSRRGRSRSPSGRSPSAVRRDDNDTAANRDAADRDSRRINMVVDASPYPEGDDYFPRDRGSTASYDYNYEHNYDRPTAYHRAPSPAVDPGPSYYRGSRDRVSGDEEKPRYVYAEPGRGGDRDRASDRESSDKERDRQRQRQRERERDSLQFLPQKYAAKLADAVAEPLASLTLRDKDRDSDPERQRERERRDREKQRKKERLEEDLAYGKDSGPPKQEKYDGDLAYGRGAMPTTTTSYSPPPPSPSAQYQYAQVKPWEHTKQDGVVRFSQQDVVSYGADPRHSMSALDPRHGSTSALDPRRQPSPGPGHRHSYSGSSLNVVTAEPPKSAMKRGTSPQPPRGPGMASLTVQTPHHSANMSLSAAPPSPLLESYHGTYQSISPMPSPLLSPSYGPGGVVDVVEPLSPFGSDAEGGDRKRSRRARFHDPVDDAARIAKALRGERRAPETEPLIEILPGLTHQQVMDLRAEYKRIVKTGTERKGVNVAKHIRARLKDEDPSLMKVCYTTALGRWESESYWANFWYQGDKTRRELLIEALMGRSNDEIRAIKDAFHDRKYGRSLSKCMKTELKEDKFKKAVLLVLEEQRMEEHDAAGRPLRVDHDLVAGDVRALHHAVRSEKGGESLMVTTVVQRSDSHLREVLRAYTAKYNSNFAKDALRKSGNLVGEIIAHILNGVINRPMRDALLLHHALTASRKDALRRELLISRLVRLHWDRQHLAATKLAFRERYGLDLQAAVQEGTKGEWGEFCRGLVISRMPDDVRRV